MEGCVGFSQFEKISKKKLVMGKKEMTLSDFH